MVNKMSREMRAKQFMPFAALKGYEEALQKKEKLIVPKAELSEEYKAELDSKFYQIKRNDIITVVYYEKGKYIEKTGMISKIDEDARFIKIVNTKIALDDILDIQCNHSALGK